MHFQEIWDSCAQNKTLEISTNALSAILGLLCAEQDVGNIKKCTFMNYGAPGRRTRRRKSQEKDTFRNYGTPVRRTRRRQSQKMQFQEFWDSCAQNKASEISRNALSGILGLLCAEQNVENIMIIARGPQTSLFSKSWLWKSATGSWPGNEQSWQFRLFMYLGLGT